MFTVYVLWSESRRRFYVGHASDLDDRLARHNQGRSKSTASGAPWLHVYSEQFATRGEAVRREREIKGWKSAARIRVLVDQASGMR
jgi:putative endonuclease